MGQQKRPFFEEAAGAVCVAASGVAALCRASSWWSSVRSNRHVPSLWAVVAAATESIQRAD